MVAWLCYPAEVALQCLHEEWEALRAALACHAAEAA